MALPNTRSIATVQYTYTDEWGWRIIVCFRAPTGEPVVQMTNIAPWGEEVRAVRMTCHRDEATASWYFTHRAGSTNTIDSHRPQNLDARYSGSTCYAVAETHVHAYQMINPLNTKLTAIRKLSYQPHRAERRC